jgi:uncharacterized damage-inducible protein DinB
MAARLSLLLSLREQSWNKEGGWSIPLATALEGLSAANASWQPPQGGYSIKQLVNHINYYNERLSCKLGGRPFHGEAKTNLDTFGPSAGADEEQWQALLSRTAQIAEALHKSLAAMTEEDLDRPYGEDTLEQYLVSWITHDSYHTGQIVLLRKLQEAWTIRYT